MAMTFKMMNAVMRLRLSEATDSRRMESDFPESCIWVATGAAGSTTGTTRPAAVAPAAARRHTSAAAATGVGAAAGTTAATGPTAATGAAAAAGPTAAAGPAAATGPT